MQIEDSFIIKASKQDVWQFIFDIPRMSKCIPGIEAVEIIDAVTYRGKLVVKVGPIKSEFGGTVLLTEINAPDSIAGSVDGDDKSSASSVKAVFRGTLTSVEGGTQAAFSVNANLRGRLAQFGGPIINATARKLTAEFAKNMRAELEH